MRLRSSIESGHNPESTTIAASATGSWQGPLRSGPLHDAPPGKRTWMDSRAEQMPSWTCRHRHFSDCQEACVPETWSRSAVGVTLCEAGEVIAACRKLEGKLLDISLPFVFGPLRKDKRVGAAVVRNEGSSSPSSPSPPSRWHDTS